MLHRNIPWLIFTVAPLWAASNPPLNSYLIQTVAGSVASADGSAALDAVFSQTEGIAVDSAGTIYVADADANRVFKLTPDGKIWTVAGTGTAGFSGDGGPAGAAALSRPYGLALDSRGRLYVADLGNARIRRISLDGTIQTVAGGGAVVPGGNGDGGPASGAQLLQPRNLAIDPDGTLYISDFGANQIYRVSPGGILTTLAGTGRAGFSGDSGAALLAGLKSPAGLALDSNGALYLADSANNRVRRVYQGIISTVYNVPAPTGVAIGPSGVLYVAAAGYLGTQFKAVGGIPSARDVALDRSGSLFATTGLYVRKVSADGKASTIAGNGAAPYFSGDGGPATGARLHAPSGIAVDEAGNWYVADTANHRIRQISAAGIVTTIAGTGEAGAKGDNGRAMLAQLNAPRSVALDSQHNLYIADTGNNLVRKVTPGGVIVSLALSLHDPEYVALDPAGSLYIAECGSNRVLKVASSGVVSSMLQAFQPAAVAVDGGGNVYVSEAQRISKITPAGAVTTLLDGLNSPRGLALTPDGDLLIAESGMNVVRRLSATGVLTTLAGTGVAGYSGDGGAASAAQLNGPADVIADLTGAVWIADSGNNRIRKLSPTSISQTAAAASIANAATLAPGPIAPGEIITIFGSGFDQDQTQLQFDGQPATIFYAGAAQINALAPLDLSPGSFTDLSVAVHGAKMAAASVRVVNAMPGIFTTGNGTGQAAAVNEDGSLNSESNPAARGSIVTFYATGQGQGAALTLKIGAYAAELLYAGPAPGFPGLLQINARVPGGFLPPGTEPVTLWAGSTASQDGVTVAVR